MEFLEACQFLFQQPTHKHGLGRMERFCKTNGLVWPKNSIHIAGTNGKGSTAALLENSFRTAGYKTGLFTSPHLISPCERIQIDRNNIDEGRFAALTTRLKSLPGADSLSFFELLTAMAFLVFEEERPDICIFETGMGGRLDATNVIDPLLTIITSIGLDHTEHLGDTVEAIAREKAGILKPGVPCILGDLPREADRVIATIAAERGVPLFPIDTAIRPATSLKGCYQWKNASMAVLAAQCLKKLFPKLANTIDLALQTTYWPARWDVRSVASNTVILDVTHNEEGLQYLLKDLRTFNREHSKPHLLFSCKGDKTFFIPALAPYVASMTFTHILRPGGCPTATMADVARNCFDGAIAVTDDVVTPIQTAANATFLVTGSCFLIERVAAIF
ncbi:MAG: hypothetical protein A2Y14_05260 [Verrucomicrobia bacterium GWF2_51_19]|nr:MAG: hypothetical protein A2Y14_05260 [Verrucomicrobia bacterium GWF2_51_19]HCJ12341.1 hypothetical protein [Opitutae bacterium]